MARRFWAALSAFLVTIVLAGCQDQSSKGTDGETSGEASAPDAGAGAVGGPTGTSEKVSLRMRFEEGQSYKMQMTTDQTINQTIQGQKMTVPQTMGFGFRQDVKEAREDGTAVMQVTYDSVLMKQRLPNGVVEYDSTNPPATVPAAAKGFAALVGQSFTLEVTPEGRVTSVQGADQLLASVLGEIPSAVRGQVELQLKDQFGNQALKEMMEQMMAIYPENPVGIGDSWSKKVVVSRGFPMIVDNKWTLKSLANGVATVDILSTVKPNPDADAVAMGPVKIRQRLNGTQTGTIEIDEATGWVLRSTLNQEFSGEMSIEGGPQDMTIPMTIEGTVSVKSAE